MHKYFRICSYVAVVSFILNVITMGNALALDLEAMQDMLMSDEVIQGVFGGVISEQSKPGDMDKEVAPAPRVITTSSGDLYINFGSAAQAQISTTAEGLTEVTYTLNGARVKMKNEENGEVYEFQYELDGQTVKLINENGVVVRQETYDNLGNLLKTASQGTVEYIYSDDGLNRLVKSIDQWGNETIYDDEGRPDYAQYTDADGNVVIFRDYTFDNNGVLAKIVDENQNTIYFKDDGIRIDHIDNFAGTTVKSYQYDENNVLVSVTDEVTQQVTTVVDGYYAEIYSVEEVVDEEGNQVLDEDNQPVTENVLVGTYNYDAAGNVDSVTDIGEDGVITGWTDYDEYGRIAGTYNSEGIMVQSYLYNERGFLQQTMTLGDFDLLTGQQAVISITNFDNKGRPMEVWQLGDGDNRVKIQEYAYKENGLLDYTNSLGILRGTDESNEATYNKPVDENGNLITDGNFVYFVTSKTTYDKKGRPEMVYALVRDGEGNYVSGYDDNGDAILTSDPTKALLEKQQAYKYSGKGFLSETVTYGFGGRITGTTAFDKYGRPETTTNAQGAKTQEYIYNENGFLTQTKNYGENGVETGCTNYDAKGKPTEVFNHKGTLTQKYVYDEYGMLVMSMTFNGEGGAGDSYVATAADYQQISALWDDSYDAEILAELGDLSNTTLMAAIWDADNQYSADFKIKCSLKLIQLFSSGAKGGDQNLINDVGSAYHMLGQFLEAEGNTAGAIAAYKIQISDFGSAMAYDADNNLVSVSSWSTDRLSSLIGSSGESNGTGSSVLTGYTIFGGDSKPIATYQVYEGQVTKVQDFVYSYEDTTRVISGYDENNRPIYENVTGTHYSNYVRKTINYGDFIEETGEQAVTGYTEFDQYGRQSATYNEEGNIIQKYNYSRNGFLDSTFSYGKDGALTGSTIFDNYARPVASFNSNGRATNIPDELIAALKDGLITSVDADGNLLVNGDASLAEDWKPYLKGLTQTFEYGDNGLLASSKSWGEAAVADVQKLDKFADAMGPTGESVLGDGYYDAAYDLNDDGKINAVDLAILEDSFNGATAKIMQYRNGTIDSSELRDFAKTFESKSKYMPTFTGTTAYDKYGKASEVANAEGVLTQKYIYNERGFLSRSETYGIEMDEFGNVSMTDGVPNALLTGYTEFDAWSRPTSTYSVYNDGSGEQVSRVQDYVYEGGFLVRTNNFGRNGADAGYTLFDKYGRQATSYNEEGQKTSSFIYSNQGFLKQTNNYGLSNAYLGKTVYNRQGRPSESYNYTGSGKTLKGLTQTFEYNEFGFLTSSTNYGQDQTKTGQTFYNGYGKAVYSTNDLGITNASYEYDSQGFLLRTNSLAWVEGGGNTAATHNNLNDANDPLNGTTQTGYYVVTGYTEFDDLARPTESYQCYWDTQGAGNGALVQKYNYDKGFLVSTTNYGADQTEVGTTEFDKYGRQLVSRNEFGEATTKFRYSNQGFLTETYNYGLGGALVGKTSFNALGKPTESYNQRRALTQEFFYDEFSGALSYSKNYGEPTDAGPTELGITTYDAFGKALHQTNEEGNIVSAYEYDSYGFLTRSFTFNNTSGNDLATMGGVCTGFTVYNAAGRPESSYSVYNPTDGNGNYISDFYGITISTNGVTKMQDFIYNTEVSGVPEDVGYVGDTNTGFITMTISYGDNEEFMGYTTFNKYGQQIASYNEYGEVTSKYKYSSSGFMKAVYNYGLQGTYTGKSVFNEYGRPVAAYNERGALVQEFVYEGGFLTETISYGEPGDNEKGEVVSRTTYDEWGKQKETRNSEGSLISNYVYNEHGFMTTSNSFGEGETLIGYTTYDNKSRPVETYNVYNDGTHGEQVSLSQVFNYTYEKVVGYDENRQPITETTKTGFVTGATMYVSDNSGNAVYAGYQEYSRYGKPYAVYNENGAIISKNIYSNHGFITRTDNYGEGGARVGSLYYDNLGRADYAANSRGGVTTDYIYSRGGFLKQTIGYNAGTLNDDGTINGVMTSYTNFDNYAKATQTYQLFQGTQTSHGWQYDSNGTKNYDDSAADGSISGGAVSSVNHYNAYGTITSTDSIGRQGSKISTTYYDLFSRPQYVENDKGAKVTEYFYTDSGFLDHSISYAEMKNFDDKGNPIDDGTWDSSKTTITYYDRYGQQTETYLLKDDGTQGALQSQYRYDSMGRLTRTTTYQEGQAGYITFDASGRQAFGYNTSNELTSTYYYDANGFLTRATQHQS